VALATDLEVTNILRVSKHYMIAYSSHRCAAKENFPFKNAILFGQ
jgi:hypothetical protein